jgi:hypothetical protein
VTLNGGTTARLVLDTGADVSVVKPQLLRAAGIDLLRPVARGTMRGVTGKVEVSYFPVHLEAAGHRALVPAVVAFDTFEDGFADGLLGRDFLDQFSVAMDPTIRDREAGAEATMKPPEEPVDQEQEQPTLIGCSSWAGHGRICRYVWQDGTVEWFTEDMVHQKGRGLAARPE